jgi:L-threonylcarbamoyladenylate synthase
MNAWPLTDWVSLRFRDRSSLISGMLPSVESQFTFLNHQCGHANECVAIRGVYDTRPRDATVAKLLPPRHQPASLDSRCAVMLLSVAAHGDEPAESAHLPVEVLKISPTAPESESIEYAAGYIKRGEVVAVPTDTFYGLAVDPTNLASIEAVFRAKGRPETKALPILVNSVEQAITLIRDVPDVFLKLAHEFWPGPLTLVVTATSRLPLKVTGNTGRVALRWANSPIITSLIAATGGPITGTSANLSGFPSCSNANQIVQQLGDRIPLILDAGDTGGSLASTIVRIDGDQYSIVREGKIPDADIHKVLES